MQFCVWFVLEVVAVDLPNEFHALFRSDGGSCLSASKFSTTRSRYKKVVSVSNNMSVFCSVLVSAAPKWRKIPIIADWKFFLFNKVILSRGLLAHLSLKTETKLFNPTHCGFMEGHIVFLGHVLSLSIVSSGNLGVSEAQAYFPKCGSSCGFFCSVLIRNNILKVSGAVQKQQQQKAHKWLLNHKSDLMWHYNDAKTWNEDLYMCSCVSAVPECLIKLFACHLIVHIAGWPAVSP